MFKRRRIIGTLILAAGVTCAMPAMADGPSGPLMIAGGEFGFGNPGWPRFVEIAGGPGARILVIPTASGSPERNGARVVEHLNSLGAAAELVPLTEADHGPARDPAWVARAAEAGGFWFIGGDQARITGALLEDDGSATPLLAAMRRANANGAIIGGSSAGAAVMSVRMFKEGPSPLEALRDGLEAGRHTDTGLGFIGDGWFVDQHFLARGRIGRMVVAMRDLDFRFGVGVEEDTAILVDGGMAEVVGAVGVVLADVSDADLPGGAPVTMSGVRLGFADVGDRFDLATGRIIPSADKEAGTAIRPGTEGFDPYYGAGTAFSTDILGPGTLLDSMARALDGETGRARGLAFGLKPEGAARNIGFEVTLYRDGDSHGWYASGTGYTISGLRMDIRPVEIADPLYRPLP